MSLKGKLKMKEKVETENDMLRQELNDLKGKFFQSERQKNQAKEQLRELQSQQNESSSNFKEASKFSQAKKLGAGIGMNTSAKQSAKAVKRR